MRYIKTYEDLLEPQIGDYVLCEEHNQALLVGEFLLNNIGEIVDDNYHDQEYPYMVKYENIPDDIIENFNYREEYPDCRKMSRKEIIIFSKNKDDIELIFTAKKYNI